MTPNTNFVVNVKHHLSIVYGPRDKVFWLAVAAVDVQEVAESVGLHVDRGGVEELLIAIGEDAEFVNELRSKVLDWIEAKLIGDKK